MTEALGGPSAHRLDDWNDDENAPQTVDDTGDGREQLDDEADELPRRARKEILAEKNGDGQARWESEEQSDERRRTRADEEGQDAVAVAVGLPARPAEKTEAEFFQRRFGLLKNFPENPTEDEDRGRRGKTGQPLEKIRTRAHGHAVDTIRTGRVGRHGESRFVGSTIRWWTKPRWLWPLQPRAAEYNRARWRRIGLRSVRK